MDQEGAQCVIGFVAQAVGADVLDGQQNGAVAGVLGQASPVVGGAAGLHQEGGGRAEE